MNTHTQHCITASTPHVIQQRKPSGEWVGVAYAVNVAETDRKLALLARHYAGQGVRFRAMPAPQAHRA